MIFVVRFQLSQVGVFSIAQLLLVMVSIAFVVVFVARFQSSQVGIHFHCTTPTCDFCCNCCGFCCRVSIAQLLLVMVFILRSQFSQVGVYFHCTTPTCGFYCNCYGLCYRGLTFKSWGFTITQFLLPMVSVVGFELSQARVWFHYYYFIIIFLLGFGFQVTLFQSV